MSLTCLVNIVVIVNGVHYLGETEKTIKVLEETPNAYYAQTVLNKDETVFGTTSNKFWISKNKCEQK